MPRNASGAYELPSGNPVISGTTITSIWANNTMSDLANEMTNSLSRNGQGGMLAPLTFVDGDALEPAIAFTSEPTLGFYREGTAQLGVSAQGSNIATFSTTGLDVVGAISSDTLNITTATLQDLTVTGTFTSKGIDDNASSTALTIDSSQNATFTGNIIAESTSELQMTNSAVGITDTIKLYNYNTDGLGNRIYAERALILAADHSNNAPTDWSYMAFETDGSERMRILPNGNVGIGETNPQAAIHVSSSNPGLRLQDSGTSGTPYSNVGASGGNLYLAADVGGATGKAIIFNNGGTECARIDTFGHFLVGTVADPSETVRGHKLNKGGVSKQSSDVAAGAAVAQFWGNAGQTKIMGDGDLENTNNRYTGISDIKFKQDIEDAGSQWDDIKNIQVRKYRLKSQVEKDENAKQHLGLVAQELETVCPRLVIERNEEDADGNVIDTYKSVAYSVLYMKAVKALQEAMERIETLEAKVAALESN